ncbi:MAG: lysylphosphatidylglycerol synthase transmembrane domain-containing protein [Planctomycetota bacterium]
MSRAGNNGSKSVLKRLPMALVSLVLVAYVIYSSDWSAVAEKLQNIQMFWVVLLLLSAPALVAASVWKWSRLLKVYGCEVSFGRLFAMYVAGQFYNNLLPTSSGGDVVRAEMLRRRCGSGHAAYGSIVAERFTGLAVLIVLAVLALIEAPAIWPHVELVLGVAAGLAFATAVMLVVLSRRITRLLDRRLGNIGPARKALKKVHDFQDSLWEYRKYPRELWIAIGFSGLFYALAIAGTVIAAESVGQHPNWWAVSVCVPLVLIVTLLPISLNGIGLWEFVFATSFAAMGMTPELGLTVALLLRARDLSWSVLGFALVTLGGLASRASIAEAAQGRASAPRPVVSAPQSLRAVSPETRG